MSTAKKQGETDKEKAEKKAKELQRLLDLTTRHSTYNLKSPIGHKSSLMTSFG